MVSDGLGHRNSSTRRGGEWSRTGIWALSREQQDEDKWGEMDATYVKAKPWRLMTAPFGKNVEPGG